MMKMAMIELKRFIVDFINHINDCQEAIFRFHSNLDCCHWHLNYSIRITMLNLESIDLLALWSLVLKFKNLLPSVGNVAKHHHSFTVSSFSWSMGYNNRNGMHIIWLVSLFFLAFASLSTLYLHGNAYIQLDLQVCVRTLLFFRSLWPTIIYYCGSSIRLHSAYFIVMDFHQHLWPLCNATIYYYTGCAADRWMWEEPCVHKHCYWLWIVCVFFLYEMLRIKTTTNNRSYCQ